MADLPDNPNNREEEYLADLAGENGTKPAKPWSRKEAYLDAIDGRMDTIDEKIAALATDISLKGGVADYDHLPTDAEIGDAYITEDTGILYVWIGDDWTPLNMQGGGSLPAQFKVLTSADYNAPSGSSEKTYINAYFLEPGFYVVSKGTNFRYTSSTATAADNDVPLLVFQKPGSGDAKICFVANATDGIFMTNSGNNFSAFVTQSLTSNDNIKALAASRGKYFENKINGLIQVGTSAPTTSTAGTVGQLLEDTTNGKLYQCTSVSGNVYTWEEVSEGGPTAPLSLYVYRGKIGDGQYDNALYKDAALTTKATVAEIHSKLKNGATVTLTTVSSPEIVDYSWRGRLSLAYALYPKECTDGTMDETTISMYFSDPTGNSTSGKKYAIASTSWGPEYTDCWLIDARDN